MLDDLLGHRISKNVIDKLEKQLKIPEGFLARLPGEDDWSFIIKLHAIFEASLSELLAAVLGRPELEQVFSNLELNAHKSGKLAFASALKLLSPETRLFLRTLSEERNKMVHDISRVTLDLNAYFSNIDKNQLEKYTAAYGFWTPAREFSYKGRQIHRAQFVKENPKLAIFGAALFTLMLFYIQLKLSGSRSLEELATHVADFLGVAENDEVYSQLLSLCAEHAVH